MINFTDDNDLSSTNVLSLRLSHYSAESAFIQLIIRLALISETWTIQMVKSNSRGPYVVFYDLKPVNKNGNLQLWKLCMMHKKELPKDTSEHVKSQFPRGNANKPPTHN